MSAESEANDLIASAPCCTILPAGTGKTEILATACKVVGEAGSRALVLTHTNAGVEAMRRRLRKLGVSAKSADVRTIASWSETWCRNYRLLGDIPTDADLDLDFDLHYRAAERILNSSSIRRVVKASWQIVLVDEYQDCRLDQHALILSLAQCLPTVVVGDPLQGVYNFRSQPTVDWERDVFESFPMLALPVVPHRWELSNPQLGEDLSRVRDLIEAGQPIDIGSLPSIRWVENSHYKRIPECKRTAELTGTSLVIHRTRAQCISLARNAGGMLEAMEDIAGKDLLAVASGMDQAGPVERLSLLLTFATKGPPRD